MLTQLCHGHRRDVHARAHAAQLTLVLLNLRIVRLHLALYAPIFIGFFLAGRLQFEHCILPRLHLLAKVGGSALQLAHLLLRLGRLDIDDEGNVIFLYLAHISLGNMRLLMASSIFCRHALRTSSVKPALMSGKVS